MDSLSKRKLSGKLSLLSAWAFAVGTAVGWGSLVVTSNTYLAEAGPRGSVLGLVIGALVMLLVSRNYAYLMDIYPDAGGAYTYSKEVFGHDHGFLTGWFLALTYLAILWANATSVPLFARYFGGNTFQFGRLYSLFGYDVYIGEILLTLAALLLFSLICMRSARGSVIIMTVLVCVFTVGISAVFIVSIFGHGTSFSPGFVPDSNSISQIVHIAVISPWAFIGFESISHGAEEFSFKRKKIFRMLVVSVATATLLYIFVTLTSVTAYPERYGSWLEYIRDRGNLSGLEALPAFYAADHYLGSLGVGLLMASLLALVMTSMIGNTMALSRLFYALGRDRVLPDRFGELNDKGVPGNAVKLIAGISLVIPFVGRTAIGWIVDVTTIGATLIYGLVSAASWKTAKNRDDRTERITGMAGLIIMIGFGLYILLPNLISTGSMERETYFLFIVWTMLGFLFFRFIMHRDKEQRFGSSVIVWVALLSLVLFISLIWMRQGMISGSMQTMRKIDDHYARTEVLDEARAADKAFITELLRDMDQSDMRTMLMAMGMFTFAMVIMITNHTYMNKKTQESEMAANRDPMTGVKSKHAYLMREKQMDEEISGGKMQAFAVAVCDVNGLKKINDTLGHQAGDDYIRAASRMVCEIFAHSPVYRIGGDEFVLILTGRDYVNRKGLMKTLHNCSVEHIGHGGVVISGGLSDFRKDEDDSFHTVFHRADELMYEEKQLLKAMGSVTRDETPENQADTEDQPILHIRRHLLIAEDVEINRLLLGQMLENDYEVLYAEDGMDALEQIRKWKNELAMVMLDLQMSRMDGWDVLRAMQSDPDMKNIPVIVITADQKAEVECLRLGAMDFITKPYPPAELIRARVRKGVELAESRDMIKQTERDPLTHLFTWNYYVHYAELFDAHYPDMPTDAIIIDISGFREIVQRNGRDYGDRLLQRTGENIRQLARKIGGVGSYRGADVFQMYCPHQENYQEILDRLSEGLMEKDGTPVKLRIGVYQEVDKSMSLDARMDLAIEYSNSIRENGSQIRISGIS